MVIAGRDPLGPGAFFYEEFFAPGLVICPRCEGPAELWLAARRSEGWPARGVPEGVAPGEPCCRRCALRRLPRHADPAHPSRAPGAAPYRAAAELPLWASLPCRFGRVFAANAWHLSALRAAVERPDRVRRPRDSNRDWRARLPGWLTARKNRADMLRLLDRLERRLSEAEGVAS